jgi:hypothetical protein
MKKMSTLLFVLSALFLSLQTQAKVWRINNTPGVNANFTDIQAALSSASVVNDDTLYIEGSATNYAGFTLSKRLVIIGTGYIINGPNNNTGLQANINSSNLGGGYIIFDSTASGSVLMGIDNFFFAIGPNLGSATDNITITRCLLSGLGTYYGYTANTKMTGWKINKSYIYSSFGNAQLLIQDWDISNNLFIGYIDLSNPGNTNNIVRNNVFRSSINIFGGYFANNIINNTTFNVLNVTIKNNLSIGAPGGFTPFVGTNGNVNNQSDATVFQGLTGNTNDGQWRLKAGSPAIGAGLTIGAVISPDCGAFGGPDPYRLAGIPNIPTIYSLTVPASIPAGTATMNITVSTRNNN